MRRQANSISDAMLNEFIGKDWREEKNWKGRNGGSIPGDIRRSRNLRSFSISVNNAMRFCLNTGLRKWKWKRKNGKEYSNTELGKIKYK